MDSIHALSTFAARIILREIKTLRGLIPVCAWCRNIRDDNGYWKQLETYLSDHLEVSFTHGICPSCLKKVRPEVYEKLKNENPALLEGCDFNGALKKQDHK